MRLRAVILDRQLSKRGPSRQASERGGIESLPNHRLNPFTPNLFARPSNDCSHTGGAHQADHSLQVSFGEFPVLPNDKPKTEKRFHPSEADAAITGAVAHFQCGNYGAIRLTTPRQTIRPERRPGPAIRADGGEFAQETVVPDPGCGSGSAEQPAGMGDYEAFGRGCHQPSPKLAIEVLLRVITKSRHNNSQ